MTIYTYNTPKEECFEIPHSNKVELASSSLFIGAFCCKILTVFTGPVFITRFSTVARDTCTVTKNNFGPVLLRGVSVHQQLWNILIIKYHRIMLHYLMWVKHRPP